MSVTLRTHSIEKILGRELTRAEVAMMKGLPPMLDQSFAKLVTVFFQTGLLGKDADTEGDAVTGIDAQSMKVEVAIAAFYQALFSVVSGRGYMDFDRAMDKMQTTLDKLKQFGEFDVTDPEFGCNDPDCEACSAANKELKERRAKEAEAKRPESVKVH